MSGGFDLAVVGAGVVGLAHAYLAAKAGLKVVVFDRDHQANGASVRNFGFVTVTGQPAGDTWRRARFSRKVWGEIVGPAGISVLHTGLTVLLHSEQARSVAREFIASDMGEGCRIIDTATTRDLCPAAHAPDLVGALFSPHEARVESRDAIPQLTAWLAERWGVTFVRPAAVLRVTPPVIETSQGVWHAAKAVVCPGHDFITLFPQAIAEARPQECKLHMLRLSDPGWRLNHAVMNDFGLVRYGGYAGCPSLPALRARLADRHPEMIADGIHLICVQSADGSLIVGDSHHYAPTVDDFAPEAVDARMLEMADRALDLANCRVIERWVGVYAASPDRPAHIAAPLPDVRVVVVTSGTGASTAFGLADDTLRNLGVI